MKSGVLEVRSLGEKMFYSLFPDIIPPRIETFADRQSVEDYFSNDSDGILDSMDYDTPYDVPNNQQNPINYYSQKQQQQNEYANNIQRENIKLVHFGKL